MNIIDRLNQDLREAVRAKDELRRTTLRFVLAAIRNAEIGLRHAPDAAAKAVEGGAEPIEFPKLSEEQVMAVLNLQVKQRRDAMDQFRQAGRADLAAKEESELAVISHYLPRQLSRDEIVAEARRVAESVGAAGPADMRKVMPPLMERLRNRADGRVVGEVVRELLASRVGG